MTRSMIEQIVCNWITIELLTRKWELPRIQCMYTANFVLLEFENSFLDGVYLCHHLKFTVLTSSHFLALYLTIFTVLLQLNRPPFPLFLILFSIGIYGNKTIEHRDAPATILRLLIYGENFELQALPFWMWNMVDFLKNDDTHNSIVRLNMNKIVYGCLHR